MGRGFRNQKEQPWAGQGSRGLFMKTMWMLFSLVFLLSGCSDGKIDLGGDFTKGSETSQGTGGEGEGEDEGEDGEEENFNNNKNPEGGGKSSPNTEVEYTEIIDWTQVDEETRNACLPDNLRPVDIRKSAAARMSLGLPVGFAGNYVDIQRGNTRGLLGVNADKSLAFVAWKHSERIASLAALRDLSQQHAVALSAQSRDEGSFLSWDAPSRAHNALDGNFSLAGNMSPAARVNDMARILLGAPAGNDVLQTAGSPSGNTQYVRAQYVLRDEGEVVVVMAVALGNAPGTLAAFGLADVAGGAALALHLDRTVVRCERSVAAHPAVDFLFVIDDSSSMRRSQEQLGATGVAMAKALNNSLLDWRVALVTSSYHLSSGGGANRGILRGFTDDTSVFQAWLTQGSGNNCSATSTCRRRWATTGGTSCGSTSGANNGCWVGTGGLSSEGLLGAARLALMDMHHPNALVRPREDADVVVVILSDTEDQTRGLYFSGSNSSANAWEPFQHFVDFFQGRDSLAKLTASTQSATLTVPPIRGAGVGIPVHAIVCTSDGSRCNSSEAIPPMRRLLAVSNATGGRVGSINEAGSIATTMQAVVDDVIGRRGIRTLEPFIGASIRVAMQYPLNPDVCNKANVQRSRQDGFDYDGRYQTVSFFGDCRPDPKKEGRMAISYRAWRNTERLPCEEDPRFQADAPGYCEGLLVCVDDRCICPPLCGNACPAGTECKQEACVCSNVIG